MKKFSKTTWTTLAIIGAFLVGLFIFIDLDAVLGVLSSIKWDSFLVASIFILGGIQIIPLRWYMLQEHKQGFLHTYQTNAITYLTRMLLPVPISLLRIVIITLTKPIHIALIVPAVVAERVMETFMRLLALIIVVSALQGNPAWAILWITILIILFAGFVRIASHSEDYAPRLKGWIARQPWGKSKSIQNAYSDISAGISTVGTPHRLISSLLFSLLMGALFLIGYLKLFEAVGLKSDTPTLLALAAGVVFFLPPSTSQMFLVYLSLLVTALASLPVIDVNTALVYGVFALGIQLVFWVIAGIWGLAHKRLGFRDILQTLNEVRDELAQSNKEDVHKNGDDQNSGDFDQ